METVRFKNKSITNISDSFRDTVDGKNKHLQHWSSRALAAEKKLKLIQACATANDKEVKKFAWFENDD